MKNKLAGGGFVISIIINLLYWLPYVLERTSNLPNFVGFILLFIIFGSSYYFLIILGLIGGYMSLKSLMVTINGKDKKTNDLIFSIIGLALNVLIIVISIFKLQLRAY